MKFRVEAFMMPKAGNPTDADSGAPAYVRHVWRYHSGVRSW